MLLSGVYYKQTDAQLFHLVWTGICEVLLKTG